MRDFSLFERALAACGAGGVEDLGYVAHISRRDFDERGTFRFRAQVPCLEYVSLLIENTLLLRTARIGRIYAGFERLSCMEPIADRYLRIADLSERVYVFGEADWRPPRHPNLQTIALEENANLAREWFVVAASPKLHVALVALDESGWTTPAHDERIFHALVTHDAAIVKQIAAATEDFIDYVAAA